MIEQIHFLQTHATKAFADVQSLQHHHESGRDPPPVPRYPGCISFFNGAGALRATIRTRRRAVCVPPLTPVPRVDPPETVQTPRLKTVWHVPQTESATRLLCPTF